MRFAVDLQKTEMLFDRVLKHQGRDLCLILDQLHGLVCGVQIVMVCVAVRFMYTVGAGLQVFHHCLAVFVCGDRRQMRVIIVNIKGEALQRHLVSLSILTIRIASFLVFGTLTSRTICVGSADGSM